jgi:glyoxylase I family protein
MTKNSLPFEVIRLDHVVLRCSHIEATIDFYARVLGCKVERKVENIGLYQLRAGDSLIDLVPVGSELGGYCEPAADKFNLAHYCLRIAVHDWAALLCHLEAHDISTQASQKRYGADGYGQSIYIDDPEGNTIELKGAPESLQ